MQDISAPDSETAEDPFTLVRKLMQDASCQNPETATKDLNHRRKVFPGGELLVARGKRVLFHEAFGFRSVFPEVLPNSLDTVYDIASLTKPLVTVSLLMQLVAGGRLSLDRKVSTFLHGFGTNGKEQITFRHLLNHSSGLPAYVPFYREILRVNEKESRGILGKRDAIRQVMKQIFAMKLESAPGSRAVYSDVGFIVLGEAIKVFFGSDSLDRIATQYIFSPLELKHTGFIPQISQGMHVPDMSRIAPTVECPWRKKLIHAEVHDDNAWAIGGVAGHAGVFSTAKDLHRFCGELLDCYQERGASSSRYIDSSVVKMFWTREDATAARGGVNVETAPARPLSTWALGWDTPSVGASSAGKYFSANSVGHLGYTGCSMWLDPSNDIQVILLSNRVHPNTKNETIKEFRPRIHDSVMEVVSKLSSKGG